MSDQAPDSSGLRTLLQRSDQLSAEIVSILESGPNFVDGNKAVRIDLSRAACTISMEHGRAMALLVGIGYTTSGITLMRLQYESLVRAFWIFYSANDLDINKLSVPLTLESEQNAKNISGLEKMLSALGKSDDAPKQAIQMLISFHSVMLKALNSFVHSSIHPLKRGDEGFPPAMVMDAIRSSNGLQTMTGMTLALLSGNADICSEMRVVQRPFSDCLPALIR